MLTQFIEVPVRSPEVEPTMTIATSLQLGDTFYLGCQQLAPGDVDVVHPESGNRPGVEMIMLHRIGAENLQKVTVGSCKTRKTGHLSGHLHTENIGEEPGGLTKVLGGRTDPDNAFDLQDLSSVDDHGGQA